MGTDGNAVDAAVVTRLDVDAVTVVATDVVAVVLTVAMLRIQEDMTQRVQQKSLQLIFSQYTIHITWQVLEKSWVNPG